MVGFNRLIYKDIATTLVKGMLRSSCMCGTVEINRLTS